MAVVIVSTAIKGKGIVAPVHTMKAYRGSRAILQVVLKIYFTAV
jgi:hypothetical protein